MSPRIKRISLIVSTVVLLFGMTFYYKFVSEEIYKESRSHLLEIYNKTNNCFSMFVSKNWSMLNDWGSYSSKAPDKEVEEQIESFIAKSKKNWGFTEFYFLNEEGEYVTYEGRTGSITRFWGSDKSQNRGEISLFAGIVSEGGMQVLFTTPTIEGSYHGFAYQGIAIGYSSDDVTRMIDIAPFDGASEDYIVYADGEVIFSTNQSMNIANILKDFKTKNRMNARDLAQLRETIAGKEVDMFQCTIDGKGYYVVCQPLLSGKGVLVGLVPMTVVNKNMREVQRLTVLMVAGLFTLILLYMMRYIIGRTKKELQDKNLELEYREKTLDMLTSSLNDVYIIFTRQYEVKYVSANIERQIGISRETVKENIHTLTKIVFDNKITLNDDRLETIAKGESWDINRYLMNPATGEKKWYQEIIRHLPYENEDDYIVIFSDRTKEQRAEEQLRSALDSAKSANEAKSMFLNNMSHDIRTPMNAILGCAELLAREAENEAKVREYTAKIISSGQFLLGLINDLLDMSKIESGKISINIAPFNLAELLEEISDILLPQAKAKQQHFEIIASKITKEQILGDKVRLGQILMNLLSNAIKYTPSGGRIVLNITCLKQKKEKYEKLRFEVSDNGIGMTQEFLDVIYEPFARAEDKVASKMEGTGLGMAITKNLVDIMGGNISVKSEPGKGSTFTVELSFRVENDDREREFWSRHNIKHILIVDDEEDICKNIKTVMKDTGVDVSYTTDGETAVKLVQQAQGTRTPYDLVLLDWKMPGMDGVETARRISEKREGRFPILILGAPEWDGIEGEALEAGIDGFMQKPFFISILRSTVKELTGADREAEHAVSEEVSVSGMHFLVVEDYELNYEILQARLEMEGATCEIAVDGKQGVDMFEASKPGHFDAVLMDVQMPVMNGYEAARAIRMGKHPCAETIPIVAMTANAFDEDIKKSKEAGMDAHIAKPIDMELLKKVIVELKQ